MKIKANPLEIKSGCRILAREATAFFLDFGPQLNNSRFVARLDRCCKAVEMSVQRRCAVAANGRQSGVNNEGMKGAFPFSVQLYPWRHCEQVLPQVVTLAVGVKSLHRVVSRHWFGHYSSFLFEFCIVLLPLNLQQIRK